MRSRENRAIIFFVVTVSILFSGVLVAAIHVNKNVGGVTATGGKDDGLSGGRATGGGALTLDSTSPAVFRPLLPSDLPTTLAEQHDWPTMTAPGSSASPRLIDFRNGSREIGALFVAPDGEPTWRYEDGRQVSLIRPLSVVVLHKEEASPAWALLALCGLAFGYFGCAAVHWRRRVRQLEGELSRRGFDGGPYRT